MLSLLYLIERSGYCLHLNAHSMRKVTSPGQLSKKNPTDEQFPCKQERDLLKTNFVYSKMSLE
jgi:hypothetical protein